ncbi:HU family DNA-binding protein [Flavobacterium sp.]|uniref:HU family DNA-binding protein n=1 Tax=Flavobacterium sp. TaxID=239 RepID=UPI002FD87DA5
MSVSIVASAKTNPRNPAAPIIYYPTAVKNGEVDLDELAEEISASTSLTPADCYGVILALVHSVSGQLEKGNIVRLGHLGSLQVSVRGEGAPTPEGVTPALVKKAALTFRPGKKLKQMLQELKYVKKR